MSEEKEGLLAWYKSLSEQRHKEIVGRDATIKQLQEENSQLISQEAILIEENKRLMEALKHLIHNAGLMRIVAENPASLLSESYDNARKLMQEPDPIDRPTSYELLVKISEQFDRFEGRLRGDLFRD